MKVLGMTGGVGSGKSTVCQVMKEEFGAAVIYTDEVARQLMANGGISHHLIVEHYGTQILDQTGEINREALARIVFSDEKERLRVNSFSHPYVKETVIKKIKELKEEGKVSYIVVETALPYEACLTEFCDEIIYVTASDEVRRQRLKASRGYSDEKITNMLKSQLSEEAFLRICTKVLDNSKGIEAIKEQLQIILK
ncbi:MAG: dephospho-CoA kinase [bacterium]|nr:dephospho-CoA kinase [bacterium]